MFVSRSYRAPAMLVSSSDGFARDGLFAAILLRAGLLIFAGLKHSTLVDV